MLFTPKTVYSVLSLQYSVLSAIDKATEAAEITQMKASGPVSTPMVDPCCHLVVPK